VAFSEKKKYFFYLYAKLKSKERVLEVEAAELFEENKRAFLSLTFCVCFSLLSSGFCSGKTGVVWCVEKWR